MSKQRRILPRQNETSYAEITRTGNQRNSTPETAIEKLLMAVGILTERIEKLEIKQIQQVAPLQQKPSTEKFSRSTAEKIKIGNNKKSFKY